MLQKNDKYLYLLSIILFLATISWGLWIGQDQNVALKAFGNPVFSYLQSLSPFWLFVGIFLNNFVKTFLVVALGFLFGIVPLYFIYVNGLLLGIVLAYAQSQSKIILALASILPHGVLEIPALLISVSYGLWLGIEFYRWIRYRKNFRESYLYALKKYFIVVFPLLLVAALVEAYITPLVISYFFR